MYVAVVPNRNSPPAVLLRESFRENGKVCNRTIANLSHWAPEKVEALRQLLKGATTVSAAADSFQILRSHPHGHVAAVVGSLRQLGLDRMLEVASSRQRPDLRGLFTSYTANDPQQLVQIERAHHHALTRPGSPARLAEIAAVALERDQGA